MLCHDFGAFATLGPQHLFMWNRRFWVPRRLLGALALGLLVLNLGALAVHEGAGATRLGDSGSMQVSWQRIR